MLQQQTKIQLLAHRFLAATVVNPATDESTVYEVLKTVRQDKAAFEAEVTTQLAREGRESYLDKENVVDFILNDEFSGSELTRAQDFYNLGTDLYRADQWDYLWEGVASNLDTMTGSAIGALGGMAFMFVSMANARIALISGALGALLSAGTLIYGTTKFFKQYETDPKTETAIKQNYLETGKFVGMLGLTLPFSYKSGLSIFYRWKDAKALLGIKQAVVNAEAVPEIMPAFIDARAKLLYILHRMLDLLELTPEEKRPVLMLATRFGSGALFGATLTSKLEN